MFLCDNLLTPSSFTTDLLRWYAENRRDLPWRDTTDPYLIWLSEVILQQTRIQQGWAYWERFVERWPTVEELAAASEDEVLRLWQGLGYYSRARNLHTAAKQIVQMGRFPRTYEDIRSLKGVGDYTAAAIASFAFGLPHAVVDGNVYRVLSRHFGIDTPINTTEGKKLFTSLANELLPADQPAAFNQAMMDFGAIQCTPQSPRCVLCPFTTSCDALRTGRIDLLPVKEKKLTIKTRHFSYLYIRYNHTTAFHRRSAGDIWQGLWEPLLFESDDFTDTNANSDFSIGSHPEPSLPSSHSTLHASRSTLMHFIQQSGIEGTLTLLKSQVKHVLTHRILLADFYLWEVPTPPSLPPTYEWLPESSLDDYAKPRLVELLLEALEQ